MFSQSISTYSIQCRNPEVIMLLFAAGETIRMADVVIPDYLAPETNNTLMNICRTSVRTHLLVASRVNLFVRVPRLGLTKLLQSFLLYDVKLKVTLKQTKCIRTEIHSVLTGP